jgi:hypothetical protein
MATEAIQPDPLRIPWFGARREARRLAIEAQQLRIELNAKTAQLERLATMGHQFVAQVKDLRSERETMQKEMSELGFLSLFQLERKRQDLTIEIEQQANRLQEEKSQASEAVKQATKKLEEIKAQSAAELASRQRDLEIEAVNHAALLESDRLKASDLLQEIRRQMSIAQQAIVATDEQVLLQEVGIYRYRHPLTDAVAYQGALNQIDDQIKSMVKKDGGAILAATEWIVNGSKSQGRAMISEISKLMLRAFNAEADNLVRGMKPFKLDNALGRLSKVAATIERLGKTMNIRISPPYLRLRMRELELTADFLQKQAEEKEIERAERDRLREERKAQQEIERERERLEKERQHYANALQVLIDKGDEEGSARLRHQLVDVDRALADVDYRAANIRAGYVYVISNVGSFGEKMVKIGMTRRLDPMDRIRELSDASVPFNFDVHALFFSKDAVGIETELHSRLATTRVNTVNRRREFFYATPVDVKGHLSELAGELLEYQETPEAIEYRQGLNAAVAQ